MRCWCRDFPMFLLEIAVGAAVIAGGYAVKEVARHLKLAERDTGGYL